MQFGKCRVIYQFAGTAPSKPSRRPSHLNGLVGLSLIQGAGRPSFHSREGGFGSALFFGAIYAAHFNVRFQAPFGARPTDVSECPIADFAAAEAYYVASMQCRFLGTA